MNDHPQAEELIAYRAGELDDRDVRRVREHLALCADCARIVLDLEGRHADADPELDGAWRTMNQRLAKADGDQDARGRARSPQAEPSAGGSSRYQILAAAVALLALTLSTVAWQRFQHRRSNRLLEQSDARIAALEQRLETLSQPQSRVHNVELLPRSAMRDPRPPAAEAPASATAYLAVRLIVVDPMPHDRFRIEIRDRAGTEIWRGSDLHPDAQGNFSILLPPGFLPGGDYLLRLQGQTGQRLDVVGEYDLRWDGTPR